MEQNDEDSMTAAVDTASDEQNKIDTAVEIATTVSVPNEEERMVDEHNPVVEVRPPKRHKIGN